MHYYPEALSHNCTDLTSVAQLSVANIADLRSAFVETLASEHFRQNSKNKLGRCLALLGQA